MSEDEGFDPRQEVRVVHYHGDTVRLLFIGAALLVFLTQFIGTKLPFSTGGLMFIIVVLVVAAGITNPVQKWIHWVNILISIIGLTIFGGLALSRASAGAGVFSESGLVAILAVIFVAALYLGTRTVRGLMVPHVPQGR